MVGASEPGAVGMMQLQPIQVVERRIAHALDGHGRVHCEEVNTKRGVWQIWHLYRYKPYLLRRASMTELLAWSKHFTFRNPA